MAPSILTQRGRARDDTDQITPTLQYPLLPSDRESHLIPVVAEGISAGDI